MTTVPFVRPQPGRTRPNRGAGNFYKSAVGTGEKLLPFDSAEAAVVAAVRMGYKIAEAQIDRTARVAQRLRDAGDAAAGPGSDRKALDATEQLVFRAMMAGLGWLEGIACDSGNPIRRLASAEYRILGSLFGLTSSSEPAASASAGTGVGTGRDETTGTIPGSPSEQGAARRRGGLRVWHRGGDRRPVQVRHWELGADSAPGSLDLQFFSGDRASEPWDGTLILGGEAGPVLALSTPRDAVSGIWKAAICDRQGYQVGYIEISL